MHNRILIKLVFTSIFGLFIFQSCSQNPNESMDINQAKQLIESGNNIQLVDVRSPEEFSSGHLKGAVNMDISGDAFESNCKSLDKNNPVYVYCLSGGRSASAAKYLRKQGYKTIELPGIMRWRAENYPLERTQENVSQGMSLQKFNDFISSHALVLVDYKATWCQPCKKMAPILEKLGEQYKNQLSILPIDADENAGLVSQQKIEALPTFVLYKNGISVWTYTGLVSEQVMNNIIQKNK